MSMLTEPQGWRSAQYAYSIPCECSTIYIGETGRPVESYHFKTDLLSNKSFLLIFRRCKRAYCSCFLAMAVDYRISAKQWLVVLWLA
jgi:hypothetical protein